MLSQIYPQTQHDYKYELTKDMHFAAAHFIPHNDAGMCANMHGHTYQCAVTIAGNELDYLGFLVNFQDIKMLVHKRFDHSVMNEDVAFTSQTKEKGGEPEINHWGVYPTTELVAREVHRTVQDYLDERGHGAQCVQVYLRETPTSYVVYRGGK
jgi:6-pyruvoyltetrahydropterin/6-carboxytetrahydropterin synthase